MNTFGVVADTIRTEYFTWLEAFSTTTNPSSATVLVVIGKQAAMLAGRLKMESISADNITDASYPVAYSMCADVLGKMAAVAIGQNMTGMNAELLKAWQTAIDAWFKALNDNGAVFLGDAALEADGAPPDGPTTHINHFGLSVTSGIEPSSIDPIFSRDDKL